MRSRLLCIVLTLMMCSESLALAQCDDKSQQNTADEAGIKGDLDAASKCATQADKERSQKKLEDAAAKAKTNAGTDGRAPARQTPNR
jgi:Ni/Co efflux regulator RcnB